MVVACGVIALLITRFACGVLLVVFTHRTRNTMVFVLDKDEDENELQVVINPIKVDHHAVVYHRNCKELLNQVVAVAVSNCMVAAR